MSKLAVLFPGQGAQSVGMGKALAEACPEARAVYDRASEILGYDLAQLSFEGPAEALTQSHHAQPAIFVHSVAAMTALQARAPRSFDFAAGLSSGEWAALYMAGVTTLEDTLRVLEARGSFMQEACTVQPGAMLSILGLPMEKCREISEQAGVQVANFNSAVQTVLSGNVSGIEKAETVAAEAGAKRTIRLQVAGAFHSVLMQPAADKFAAFLADVKFSEPTLPVLSNVSGEAHVDAESIRSSMVIQITSSVQWVKNVEWMKAQGVSSYIECGPGKVLTGLVKRIDNTAALHNIQDFSGIEGLSNQGSVDRERQVNSARQPASNNP